MKLKCVCLCVIVTVLSIGNVGCQSGKAVFPDLAWWKKNDTPDSNFIEPPSHQFAAGSDSKKQVVATTEPDLPPLPPSVRDTGENFAHDTAQSYRDLIKQTESYLDTAKKQTGQELAQDLNDFKADVNEIAAANGLVGTSSGFTPKTSPLQPRTASTTQSGSANKQGSDTKDRANSSFVANNLAPPRNGGFVPRSSTNGGNPGSGNRSNTTDFAPASSSASRPGLTEYEKLALNTFQPSLPTSPTAAPHRVAATSQSSADKSGGDFNNAAGSDNKANGLTPRQPGFQTSPPSLDTDSSVAAGSSNKSPETSSAGQSTFQPRLADNSATPPRSSAFVPQTPSAGSDARTTPIPSIESESLSQVNYEEYPSTPFKPYQPRTQSTPVPGVQDAVNQVRSATEATGNAFVQAQQQFNNSMSNGLNKLKEKATEAATQATNNLLAPVDDLTKKAQAQVKATTDQVTQGFSGLSLSGRSSYTPGSIRLRRANSLPEQSKLPESGSFNQPATSGQSGSSTR